MGLNFCSKDGKYDNKEKEEVEVEVEVEGEAVSPSSQSLSTSILSLCIQIILEFEQPVVEIDRSKKILTDALMPNNPRFSSLLEEDDKGMLRWRKTTVNVDDHIVYPQLPPGHESYDDLVNDYISNLCLKPFDHSRPLWEIHLLNYKTSKAQATLIIKVHHAVGDGISLMSALFSCVRRADNPTLPPSFPASKKIGIIKEKGFKGSDKFSIFKYFGKLWYMVLVLCYTMADVIDCLLRMMGWREDSKLPIRGPPGVEYLPVSISSTEFPMVDIKQIKSCIGGTVNDVLTGIIFCGIQRYLQICLSTNGEQSLRDTHEKRCTPNDIIIKQMKNLRVTTLTMINQRTLARLERLEEMNKNTEVRWGNHFGFLHLQIPLETALAKCAYNTIASTTMAISNMVGPMEKIAIDVNPVKRFSFFVSGAPQSLSVHILSYMDTITMQVIAQKD